LRFVDDGDRTVLAACKRTPPLHVQRPLYLDRRHPSLAHVALLNATAGLFAGDRLDTTICLGAGAAVALTTPTMTRVFTMPGGHAEVSTHIVVGAGGYLELLPEATLLCRGAALRQRLTLDAPAGANVAIGEVFAFGRAAHGERHAYQRLEQRANLSYGGRPVLAEGLSLDAEESPNGLGVIGDFAAYGSLNLLTPDGERDGLLAATRDLVAHEQGAWAAASMLPAGSGVAVRVLGDVPSVVQHLLKLVVAEFRVRHAPATAVDMPAPPP
jgi:urease accessory protein